jgi:uncharacterized protein (UPF0548 family)
MFLLRRPSPERLGEVLAGLEGASATYDEVGATKPAEGAEADALPAGYHHVRVSGPVGEGPGAFEAAVAGVRGWRMHRGQGFDVLPADPPIAPGTTVLSVVRLPGAYVLAGCRIAWVVDEPDRFGFGYGTLPVHPARGEEAFVVARGPDGRVLLHVTAFSAPRHPLMRLGAPVARRQQERAAHGYVDALRAAVAG